MAPKVTSSGNRSGRKPNKPPVVTSSKGRNNRSSVSTARVSTGSNGKPQGGGGRVTNASQRTNTGSTRVTGGGNRAALPPAKPKPNAAPTRPSIGNVSGPASNPKPAGTNANLRPGNSRTAPSIPTPAKPSAPAPKPSSPNFSVAGARRLLGGVLSAAGSTEMLLGGSRMLADQLERSGITRAPKGSRTLAEREKAAAEPVKPKPNMDRPGLRYEKMFDTQGGRGNYGLDKPQAQAPARPADSRSTSSSTPSRSTSTPVRMPSSVTRSSAPKAPAAPAKAGQKFEDFNPGRGTSKTNNPLMKDMVGRMKDREDKAQASAASKVTSKFNTESNFSAEKVDGSKVDTKAKMKSTTSEYDKKKRRYGG